MSKPFYADYVNHMLSFYAKHLLPNFKNAVDKMNWESVHTVLQKFPDSDQYAIIKIYKKHDTLSDNIYSAAQEIKIDQDILWNLIARVTTMIAKERKLI